MRFLYDDIVIEAERKVVRGLRLVVRPDASVHLSIPLWASTEMVDTFIRERLDWIRQAQEKQTARPHRVLRPVSDEQRAELIRYLMSAVPLWCERMGEEPVGIRLRNMKSQWGNCRWRERLITFNLQLALVPHHLVDYIIVHELAHLKVQNHSKAFHDRVQLFLPNEKELRAELRRITQSSSL